MNYDIFPFPAIIGQEPLKTALILNAINPRIGGVLIRGEKGTAKSTTVRALADLLPGMPLVTLPLNATEDRVAGGIDFSLAVRTGARTMQEGLLARAHKGFLYVDEVNLLDDHIVDLLLDSAAMGVNTVEREGVSYSHPADFILVGTMNPEEGELRPQLIDRFGLCVKVSGISEIEKRVEVIRRRSAFEADSAEFTRKWAPHEDRLARAVHDAKEMLERVEVCDEALEKISRVAVKTGVDGHRADLTMVKAAKTIAAFHGRETITDDDIVMAAELSLYHRVRRKPFEEIQLDMETVRFAVQD